MTIGDRRASILGEMPGLQKKMKGEGFLTDAQKDELAGVTGKARDYAVNSLRAKYQDETDNLQLRYNREKGDLKEKPLNFKSDSLSNAGLYSASNVAFNPLIGIQQKQLTVLQSIDRHLSPPKGQTPAQKDPYHP